jgi:Concanavalin A-like lectin/glucanases superfamily
LRTRFSTLGRAALLIAALLVTSAAAGVQSASAAWIKVAIWEMNEPAGAHTMQDSSGKNRDGAIGTQVTTGVVDGNYKGYQFTDGPKDIQRLVVVDNAGLNPYRNVFKVFLRFKTSATNQNIVQKGQANTSGGSWKIEVDTDGHLICTFRGAAGRGAVGSRGNLANGVWHGVTCIRRATEVVMIVDGGIPRKDVGRTGRIDNNADLTIGGKKSCTAPNVSCQYYTGLLDRIAIRRR